MRNSLVTPVLAMVMGTGLGMLISVGAQKLINSHYQETCPQRKGHSLVMITSFIGDSYFCLDKRYM
jgi:hypothetical protein